uniref:Neuropeptide F n=1 Tax=Strigamia maritima TaxID=126957 RepID=T1JM02_STRMM
MSLSISTRSTLALICVIVVLYVFCAPAQATSGPDQAVSMTEALKYLQALDKYYSQVARPRFGRSLPMRYPSKDMSVEAEANRLLEQRRR